MKTFNQFQEATEQDLKRMGASPAQIKALKDRAKRRGGTGVGVQGSTGSHFHQKDKPIGFNAKPQYAAGMRNAARKQNALALRNPNAIKRQGAIERVAGAAANKGRQMAGTMARRAADKGSAIVRQKASEKLKAMRAGSGKSRRMADSMAAKSKDIVPTNKERVGKEAIGQERKSGPGVRQEPQAKGPGSKTYDRAQPGLKGGKLMAPDEAKMRRERELQKKLDAEERAKDSKGGFMGGVKKSLGGDLIHPDKDKRREARFAKGKEMADGAKQLPGKAAGALNRLRKKGLEKKDIEASGAGDAGGSEFVGSSGSARLQ